MEQQQGDIHIRKVISHKSGVPYGSMLNFGAILGVNLDESSIEPSSASGWSGNCSPWFRPFFLHGQRFRRSSYVHSISTLSPAARFKNIPIEGDLWWFDVIWCDLLIRTWLTRVGNLFQDVSSTADQPLICSFLKKPTLVCCSSVEMGGPMFFVHVARSQVGYPMRLLWHLWKT